MNLNIEVRCSNCWSGLETEFNERHLQLDIYPCKNCIDEAHEKGVKEGIKDVRMGIA